MHHLRYRFHHNVSEIKPIILVGKYNTMKKSPIAAGFLETFPGAGYAYIEKPPIASILGQASVIFIAFFRSLYNALVV